MTDAPSSVVTFVTAYMNIYPNNRLGAKDMTWRFEQFAKIAQTGIQLCVYVDESSTELLDQFIAVYPNIRRMRVFKNVYDTWVYGQWRPYRNMHNGNPHQGLPRYRHAQKDTLEYMILMHTKMECLSDAIQHNPWKSQYFAWIDFNIAHIFKNTPACQAQLRTISSHSWKMSFLAIPGCWMAMPADMKPADISSLTNQIHWRFCGGFFFGDVNSVSQFCQRYYQCFPIFLKEFNRMVWEVNLWSWMENKITDWKPLWYAADHNDTMLKMPDECWSFCLAEDVGSYTSIEHDCPDLGGDFHATSICICSALDEDDGYWINTRYVNYILTDKGYYMYPGTEHVIVTRNVCTRLDSAMMPLEHFEMANPEELTSYPCDAEGVEDIRIWMDETDQCLHFVGSTMNYVAEGKTRIMQGTYDVIGRRLSNAVVVQPPTDTACEKNWCPLPGNKILYNYSDMTIGHVDPVTNQLVVDSKLSDEAVAAAELGSLRGSTYFRESLDYPGCLIGLMHFSVSEYPRHYYHVLLLLDAETLRPVRRSRPFSFFRRNNIEFCIGMMETRDGNAHFWVSQFDREPRHVTVARTDLPLTVVM